MPTAAEFDAMASALEGYDEQLGAVPNGIIGAVEPTAIRGGPVATLVTTTVDQAVLNVSSARTHVAAAAALCRERAELCRRYTAMADAFDAAMSRYAELAADPEHGQHLGSPPYPPRLPGSWCTRG